MRVHITKYTAAHTFVDDTRRFLNQMSIAVGLIPASADPRDFAFINENAKEIAMLIEVRKVFGGTRPQLSIRGVASAKDLIDFAHDRRQRRFLHRVEQLLFVAVVQINCTFSDAHFLRHPLHRHALQAFAADETNDRLLNRLTLIRFPGAANANLTSGHDRPVIL